MICIARTFGAPETRAGRKAGHQRIDRVVRAASSRPIDVRDDVHDVAVALDDEALGDLDRADLGDPADVVAAEIEQHQVLGPLLRVGEQRLGQMLVLGRRRAAPRGCRRSAGW